MAKIYPKVNDLKELQVTLAQMKLNNLSVGQDGRNRCPLKPFKSRTSRNQPSTSKFIFGPSVWMRSLIKPEKGRGLSYIDYSQQEFAIAGALSGDENMKSTYRSGDPYLAFAKLAGVVPENATKSSHPTERELFKQCVLGVQYGMGARSLALSAGVKLEQARQLLKHHKRVFADFWRWSDDIVKKAARKGYLVSRLGWKIHIKQKYSNERSIRNFLMQSNGAEILRLAISMGVDGGLSITAPVHDAIMLESSAENLVDDTDKAKAFMVEAGRQILNEFELRVDDEKVYWPDRYEDERGRAMWNAVGRYIV